MEKDFQFRGLNRISKCERSKYYESLNLQNGGNTRIQQKAGKTLDILQKALLQEITVQDIPAEVKNSFEELDTKNPVQLDYEVADTSKNLIRCVESMNDHYPNSYICRRDLQPIDIDMNIGGDEFIIHNVCPDILINAGDSIIAAKFHIGKARKNGKKLSEQDSKKDPEMYALLKYAERLCDDAFPAGTVKICQGAELYLTKMTDVLPHYVGGSVKSTKGPHYDPDFFYNDSANSPVYSDNVVALVESYTSGKADIPQASDYAIIEVLNSLLEGTSKEECAGDCETCKYRWLCNYVKPVKKIEEEEKPLDLSDVNLSDIQNQILTFNSGYGVVNAVPGAGKTFILCMRVVQLLMDGVKPEEMCILSFTNSAAEVFKTRIQQYNENIGTGADTSPITACTINKLCMDIICMDGIYQKFGFSAPPKVIDNIERARIINDTLLKYGKKIPDLDYRNFDASMRYCKGALTVAADVFRVMKENNYTAFDADDIAAKVGIRFCSVQAAKILAEDCFAIYEDTLKSNNLVEFADQEAFVMQLLEEDPYFFDQFGFKHIMLDEAQDTSAGQFKILQYMTKSPSFESLMVVGDDSQSIYRFRGTSPEFFIDFADHMGIAQSDVKQFNMVENFRSVSKITDFANKLIQKNYYRVQDKDIQSMREEGADIQVKGFFSLDEEYDWIANAIKEKIDSGIAPEDIVFISATKTEQDKLADRLTNLNIPAIKLSPERYLENSRVIAALAAVKALQNPEDTDDLMIVLNAVFRGNLDQFSKEQILQGVENKRNEFIYMKSLPEEQKYESFFEFLELLDEDDEIYQGFLENLKLRPTTLQVIQYCKDFEQYGDREEKRREHNYPGVALTTAHSSKGMEWKYVYASLSKFDTNDLTRRDDIEEKRRLVYVAATRARNELTLTSTYVAYGKQGDYHFNRFLEDALDVLGTPLDANKVSADIALRKEIQKKERAAARKKLQEETAQHIDEMLKKKAEQNKTVDVDKVGA